MLAAVSILAADLVVFTPAVDLLMAASSAVVALHNLLVLLML